MSDPVSDFEVLHELAARYGGALECFASLPEDRDELLDAYFTGGAVGLVTALRAQMQAQRDADEAGAAATYKRAEDSEGR